MWADQFGRPQGDRRVGETGCGADRSRHPADHRRGEAVGDRRRPPRPCCTCRIGSCGCGPTRPAPPHRDSTRSRRSPTRSASSRSSNLRNTDRILGDYGCSARSTTSSRWSTRSTSRLADMMVTSEYVGRPRRWATGIELTEEPVLDDDGNPVLDDDDQPVMTEVNPIPEGHRAMISRERRRQVRATAGRRPRRLRGVGAGAPRADHGRVHAAGALRRRVHRQPGIRRCPPRRRGQS